MPTARADSAEAYYQQQWPQQRSQAQHDESYPVAVGGGAGRTAASSDEQMARQQQEHHVHSTAMTAAFRKSQAASHSQWDLWAGFSLSVLLLLALPSSLQRDHWRSQLVAVLLEVSMRVGPAWLACLTWDWYWPRRTYIVAACRLASAALPHLAVQPSLPVDGWGGWPQFLLFSRTLGINTLPWLARLPFKWFVWVHLVSVVDAARLSLVVVSSSPAFTGAEAQQHYASATRLARLLAMLAPTPSQQSTGGISCLDSTSLDDGASTSPCACHQMAFYVLACVGYALPLAVQFLTEAAAQRRFYRKNCRRPQCEGCSTAKGTDLLMLTASVMLLFAGFCAVCWQLVGVVFVPKAVGAAAAVTVAATQSACGTAALGPCPSGM